MGEKEKEGQSYEWCLREEEGLKKGFLVVVSECECSVSEREAGAHGYGE